MNDDHCDATGPDGLHCTLPPDHGGNTHRFEVELPRDVGSLVAHYIDHLEEQGKELDRHIKRMRWARWVLLSTAAFNIGVSAYYFVLILMLP